MNESEIIAQVEKRERAMRRLRRAVAACELAQLTREEILRVLHPDGEQTVILDGNVIDRLSDRDATTFVQLAYRALVDGAAFLFTTVRNEADIRSLCAGAGIGDANISVTHEGHLHRVALVKLL